MCIVVLLKELSDSSVWREDGFRREDVWMAFRREDGWWGLWRE